MSEVPQGGGGKGKGKARAKKHSTKIDMTPMVDLAFLLLTFFILTTTLAEQKTLDIILPVDDKNLEEQPKVNNAITVIMSADDKIYYYEDELKTETKMEETDFKGIRNVIAKKNEVVVKKLNTYYKDPKNKGADFNDSIHKNEIKAIQSIRESAFVIIKYDSLAKYRNAIDLVDEMDICGVPPGKYAIVKQLEKAEKVMIFNTRNR